MILNSEHRDTQVVGDMGELKSMKISASEEVQDHIIKILTETGYKQPIESLVRESVSNCIDSHRANGTPTEPIIVTLGRDIKGIYFYSCEDKGTGLNEDEFDQYIMNIGDSTKRTSNDYIGAMG